MKRLLCILAIAFMVMGLSPMQITSNIYVSTIGNDANTGTSVSPLRTIQKAVSVASPGMVIYVDGGTYNENVILTKSGTVSLPITLLPVPGKSVIINGGSDIAIRNQGAVSYWVIRGLTIKSTGRYTLRLGWWGEPMTDHFTIKSNMIYGANYIMGSYHLWESNNIDGTGYTGAFGDAGISDAGDSHHNIYRDNLIHDFTSYNARGIWTQGMTHETLIENNTITNISPVGSLGQCIDLDGYENVEFRHTVRGNIIENCSYVGIQLENVFDSIVENNIIKDSGKSGITVISYDNNGCKQFGIYGDQNGDGNCQGDNTMDIIRGNLITADVWGWGYGGIMNWYAGGLSILNNTVVSNRASGNGAITFDGTYAQTKGGVVNGNILRQGGGVALCATDFASFNNYSGNDVWGTYGTGDNCQTPFSGKGNINADPLFVDGFKLSANSLAQGMGAFVTVPVSTATLTPTSTATKPPTITRTVTPTPWSMTCTCSGKTCTCVVK
jgi:hypothetical protein